MVSALSGAAFWWEGGADAGDVADTLDRCEVPFFGPLASRILDDE